MTHARVPTTERTILLACFDPRQWAVCKAFCQRTGLIRGQLHRASGVLGGAHRLLRTSEAVRQDQVKQLLLCVKHHNVQRIIVVNHEDCRAYTSLTGVNDRWFHAKEVRRACQQLRHDVLPASQYQPDSILGLVCVRSGPDTFSPELIPVFPHG